MRPRHLYPLALVLVVIVLGSVAFSKGLFSGEEIYTPPEQESSTATASTLVNASATSSQTSYTLADVAEHASKDSCWTAVNGSVYDLTPFIPMHPGGDRILAICGIDGTSAFEAQHGNTQSAQSELATLKIGTLAK